MHFPMTIGVRRSSFLAFAVLLVHVAANFFLFLPDWPVALPAVGSILLLISGLFSRRQCLPKIQGLRLLADGRLECRFPGEEMFHIAELLPGATVHPALTVLSLQCEGKALSVVLLPDSVPVDDYRRLRVWLRWRASFGQEGKTDSVLG